MSETTFPDWLPDWRDSSQYSDPESTSRKQWAWEFLRRNKQYQDRWKQKDTEDYSDSCSAFLGGCSPEEYEYYKSTCMVLFGAEWGLGCPAPDPSIQYPELLAFYSSYHIGVITYEDVEKYGELPGGISSWSAVSVVFDLESPIPRQIEEAKDLLEQTQKRFLADGKIKPTGKVPRSPSAVLLQTYLRCLDGREEGASTKEIAEVVFPYVNNDLPELHGNQRVLDCLKAGSKLVKSNYSNLAIMNQRK